MLLWLKALLLGFVLVLMASLQARSKVDVKFESKGRVHQASLYAFDNKAYQAAYMTFVGSGELMDAYVVALAAIKQRPKDLEWREKLYQVARWSGHDEAAMQQLLYLIDKTNKIKFIDLGIKMAELQRDPEILRNLLRLKASLVTLTEAEKIQLAGSLEGMGEPEQAIGYLKQQWKQKKKVIYLKKMADVYAQMGAVKLEIQVLKLLHKYEVRSTKTVEREAKAYYKQNNLQAAYEVMSSIKHSALKSDKSYWSLYADIAWQLQKNNEALYAYKLLDNSNGLTDNEMRRYISLVGKYDVHRALVLSIDGWGKFKQPVYLLWFVQYSLKLDDWNAFDNLSQRFGSTAMTLLKKMPAYQTAVIQSLLERKRYAEAKIAYLNAIKDSPEDANLKLAYMWFLVDRKMKPELRYRMLQWQKLKYSSDNYTLAFAVSYRLLGYQNQAIALMRRGLSKHMKDVVYLTNYLDQLMEMRSSDGDPSDIEREVRAYIWALIQLKAANVDSWKDKTFPINYAKVARVMSPGQPTVAIMSYLSQFSDQEEAMDTAMAWALANRYYQAALRIYHQSKLAGIKTAPWIRLTMALHRFDKDKMFELLENEMVNLPHRDRVVAAHLIGEETQAEQLAYEGLKEYPSNQKTYELFKQTMLPRSDYWDLDSEHVTTQLLMWQAYDMHGRYFVSPSFALMPYFDVRDQNGRNSTFITNVPRTDSEAGLRVHKILPRGYIDGSLGARDAMKTFATSDWQWMYRLTNKWAMLWDLGIHQMAEESDYMTAGAMQNRIGVRLIDQVTVRDQLALEGTQHYFYGQDEESLSNGQVYRASYTRRMWLQYPDYFFRLFGSVNQFHNVADPTGSIDSLVPPGQQAANSGQLLLPASFIQYGLTVGVGERYREEYTHEWKPFAIASVFRNNNSAKLGTVFDGGIAGTVFGRDHLALFSSYTSGVTGNNNTRFELGAAYRIYF